MPKLRPTLLSLLLIAGAAAILAPASQGSVNTGRKTYIIHYRDETFSAQAAGQLAGSLRVRPLHVYRHALRGFAAELDAAQVRQLRRDPRITLYEDGPVEINPSVQRVVLSSKKKSLRKIQAIPTGIARCGALRSPTADIDGVEQALDVDVAVLDTGIDPRHPDLNVVGGVSVIKGSYADKNGHGTHVAGIIGARDNGFGVVGVAPGARLWSVRVLNARGRGTYAGVIAALDWVTERANVIEVANLSFSGTMPDDTPFREAVERCVNAGVTTVVAAGNGNRGWQPVDVAQVVPGRFESAITVSALADSNGEAGPSAGGFKIKRKWWEVDEEFGSFSNYGANVALVAPGAKILSTLRGGKYGELTGTSQAAPHVAGAAALYKVRHPEATPQQIRAALTSVGADFPPAAAHDGMAEPALDVSSL